MALPVGGDYRKLGGSEGKFTKGGVRFFKRGVVSDDLSIYKPYVGMGLPTRE